MWSDRRRCAFALYILSTAQFAQAGPLRWTNRIYQRETPVDVPYATSAASTVVSDSYAQESSIFESSTSVVVEASSIATPSVDSLQADLATTIELLPIDEDTTTAAYSQTPANTVPADTSVAYTVDTSDFNEGTTLTTSIVPEQPTETPSSLTTSIPAEETTTTTTSSPAQSSDETTIVSSVVPGTPTTAVQLTSEETSAQQTSQTSQTPIYTSIVPGTPTTAAETSEETSTVQQTQTPSEQTSAVQQTQTPSEETSAVEQTSQTSQTLIFTSIVPQQPTSAQTPVVSSVVSSAEQSSTPVTSVNYGGTAPGSSIINTPTSVDQVLSTTATFGSTMYQETPGAGQSTPSVVYSSVASDQDNKESTTLAFKSSVDLGGLQPTSSTPEQQTTVVEETSAASTPATSVAYASQPASSVVVSTPSNVQEPVSSTTVGELPGTPTSGTTVVVSVGQPGETTAAGSSAVQTTYEPVSTDNSPSSEPASSSEPAVVSSTTAASSIPVSTIVATGTPNSAVPTVGYMPTATASVDADQYAANLAQAKQLNKVYSGLTTDSACTSGQAACINGQFAQCNDSGSYTIKGCEANKKCYAFPATTTNGVMLACQDVDEAKEVLGDSAVDETTTVGGASSTVAEQPATSAAESVVSSVAEKPATTTEAGDQGNVPVVTVTQIVTVDDGDSATTSEPADEVTSVPVEKSSVPATSAVVITSEPVNNYPSEPTTLKTSTTSKTSAVVVEQPSEQTTVPVVSTSEPVISVPSSTTEAPIVTTISVPVANQPSYPTSSPSSETLPAGTTTVVNSIQQPDEHTSEAAVPVVSSTTAPAVPVVTTTTTTAAEVPVATTSAPAVPIVSSTSSSASLIKASTILLIPVDAEQAVTSVPAAQATEAVAVEQGHSTTQVVDGVPTVSIYLTVTVTEKDHETVTVTETQKETRTVIISA